MKLPHYNLKPIIIIVLIFLIPCILIFSYHPKNQSVSGKTVFNTSPDKLNCKIDIWSWDVNAIEALTEKFNEKYPNVKVNIMDTAWADVPMKLKAAIMTGNNVPDVVQVEIGFLGDIRNLDGLENLSDPPYNGSEFDGKFVDYYEPLCRNKDGKFTSLPVAPGASATFYRRDIAKKYLGTDDPDELEKLLSDWDKALEAGRRIKEKSGGSVALVGDASEIYDTIIRQMDTVWVDKDGILRFEDKVRQAANMAVKVRREGLDAGAVAWSSAWMDLFKNGSTFVAPSGTWLEAYVIKVNDPVGYGKWGVISTPGGNVNNGGSSYAIPSAAKQKEAAWYWVRQSTTDPATQLYHFEKTANYPALKTVIESPVFNQSLTYFNGQKAWNKYVQMIKDLKTPPINKYDFLASRIASENVNRAISGKISVDQAINESEYQIKEIINILERK